MLFPFTFCCLADQLASEFVREFAAACKSSVSLTSLRPRVHVLLSCASLDTFDRDVAGMASTVNIWADVGGHVASL